MGRWTISGALDVPEFQRLAEFLVDNLPRATRIVVPGAAYMVSMEKPEELNKIVQEFIEKIEG